MDLEALPTYTTDVLVIGGGRGRDLGGAHGRASRGCKVILATKLRHGDANTIMAEGGIQGADHEVDSPYYHYLDCHGRRPFHQPPRACRGAHP